MFILHHVDDANYDETRQRPIELHHVNLWAKRSIRDCLSDFFHRASAPHRTQETMYGNFYDPNYGRINLHRPETSGIFHTDRQGVEDHIAKLEPRGSIHLPALLQARAAFAELDGMVLSWQDSRVSFFELSDGTTAWVDITLPRPKGP